MNEFERRISNAMLGRNTISNRNVIKAIVRDWLQKDGVVAGIYRDNENVNYCNIQVVFFQLADGSSYIFMDLFSNGKYGGSQLEKFENDFVSRILYSTDNDNPESLGIAMIELIKKGKLIEICVQNNR